MLAPGAVPPLTLGAGVVGAGLVVVGAVMALASLVSLLRHYDNVRRITPPRVQWAGHPSVGAESFRTRVLADEPSVWGEIEVLRPEGEGRARNEVKILSARWSIPFRIEVAGERVDVDPSAATVEPQVERRAVDELDAEARERLSALVVLPEATDTLSVVERWIPAAALLHVTLTRPNAARPAGAYREEHRAPVKAHIGVGSRGQYLLLFTVTSLLGAALTLYGGSLVLRWLFAY